MQESSPNSTQRQGNNGAALIGALIVILLSTIVMGTILGRVAYQTKTASNMKQRDVHFYEAEDTLGKAVNWLRNNQMKLASAFVQPAFNNLFEKSAFSAGANDSADFPVITRIKIKGTSNSFILGNAASSFTAAAPAIPQAGGAGTFSAQDSFENADLGNGDVRITLVDAVPVQ